MNELESITLAERWLPVPGYEGFYEISDLGRVRSVDRVVRISDGRLVPYKGKLLSAKTSRGYKIVNLHKPGIEKYRTVHSLVLEAFIGPRPDGLECCHWDGNPANNVLSNLRWDTRSANGQDRVRHGNSAEANRTHCPRRHLLVAPNLRIAMLRQGKRICLACARARAARFHARKAGRPVPEFQELSDRYYAEILASAA